MNDPYQSTTVADATPGRPRSLLGILAVGSAVVVLVLLVINVLGLNLYFYLQLGGPDVICAASTGVLHAAVAPHADMTSDPDDVFADAHFDLVNAGPVHIFAERRFDRMQLFRFSLVNHDDGYVGLEVPLVVVGALLLGIASYRFVRLNRAA